MWLYANGAGAVRTISPPPPCRGFPRVSVERGRLTCLITDHVREDGTGRSHTLNCALGVEAELPRDIRPRGVGRRAGPQSLAQARHRNAGGTPDLPLHSHAALSRRALEKYGFAQPGAGIGRRTKHNRQAAPALWRRGDLRVVRAPALENFAPDEIPGTQPIWRPKCWRANPAIRPPTFTLWALPCSARSRANSRMVTPTPRARRAATGRGISLHCGRIFHPGSRQHLRALSRSVPRNAFTI
jgi:hypothetical protein